MSPFIDAKTFNESAERLADVAVSLSERLKQMNDDVPHIGETKRYLSLARTAAQESELWLGKAMVAFSGQG